MSVSLLAKNSMDADGLSTAVFSLGLQKGRELVDNIDGVEAVFITRDKEVVVTEGIKETFTLMDNDFRLRES